MKNNLYWKLRHDFLFNHYFHYFVVLIRFSGESSSFTSNLLCFQYGIQKIFANHIQACIRESFWNYFPQSGDISAKVTFLERLYFLWLLQRQCLTLSWRRSKSMDWFLYDWDVRHKIVINTNVKDIGEVAHRGGKE